MVLGAERSAPEARRASIRRAVYLGSVQNRLTAPELDEAARARLDPFYGIAIVENDPYAPDCAVFEDDAAPVLCPLTVGKRDPRPCSQPNGHGGPCKARERLAPIVAPSVAPEPDPIATAAARLAPGAPPAATRPTCPRCGQTFRLGGTGYAWHVANRPDCSRNAA
jgi:hypothetical protein